jgi:hypothetical protein
MRLEGQWLISILNPLKKAFLGRTTFEMGTGFRTSGLVCLSILKVSRTSKLAIFAALNQKNTIPRVLNRIAIE